jgi:hypothetical protein
VLERVKLALRLKTDAFDNEITDIIAACVHDMSIAGVDASSALPPVVPVEGAQEPPPAPAPETAPLIIRAVVLYAKAEFGNNPDAQKYRDAYMGLKTYLSIAAIGGEGV